MSGALEGVKVVDVTAMITGPLATTILADQGADVVKVEPPGAGDLVRYMSSSRGGMSTMFSQCNRGKRSAVVNLKEEAGRDLLVRLAGDADVFIQNFRPGVVERLGIDEPALRKGNPRLIYVSISAFGDSGPWSHKPAFDHIIQALTGVVRQQGEFSTGEPEFVRNAFCDKVTAYTAAQSITAALFARERTGRGQHLKLAMVDAALSFLWPDVMTNHTLLGEGISEMPSIGATYSAAETTDGHVAIAAVTDAQFAGMLRATGRGHLVEDPRFATLAARMANMEAARDEMVGQEPEFTTAELLERLEAEDVPCGPVLGLDDVHTHPQVVANESLVERDHPVMGRMREPRPPTRFSDTQAGAARPAPALGEHTDEVLRQAGVPEQEIADLRGKGVVA